MKIIRFQAENFKKLKCVEVKPNGDIVLIRGQNANGKSSVLDAIWAALQWKSASKVIPRPINDDATSGSVQLDIGEYIITRKFSKDDEGEVTTKLSITKPNGDIVRKPQSILDGLMGRVSFDPMEFSRMDKKKQSQVIADLVDLDLAEFESKKKKASVERLAVRKEIKRLEALTQSIMPPTDNESRDKVSVKDLISEYESLDKIEGIKNNIEAIEIQIKQLTDKKNSLEAELSSIPKPSRSRLEIQRSVDEMDKVNERVEEINRYDRLKEAVKKLKREEEVQSATIGLADIEMEEAIENADLPIDNLSINEEGVFINDMPWDSLSSAEQIRHSMAIAMACNPHLRVVRVTDGSLLDNNSMDIIADMAKDKDFQVWIEVVSDEPNGAGVYLEQGEIL